MGHGLCVNLLNSQLLQIEIRYSLIHLLADNHIGVLNIIWSPNQPYVKKIDKNFYASKTNQTYLHLEKENLMGKKIVFQNK